MEEKKFNFEDMRKQYLENLTPETIAEHVREDWEETVESGLYEKVSDIAMVVDDESFTIVKYSYDYAKKVYETLIELVETSPITNGRKQAIEYIGYNIRRIQKEEEERELKEKRISKRDLRLQQLTFEDIEKSMKINWEDYHEEEIETSDVISMMEDNYFRWIRLKVENEVFFYEKILEWVSDKECNQSLPIIINERLQMAKRNQSNT